MKNEMSANKGIMMIVWNKESGVSSQQTKIEEQIKRLAESYKIIELTVQDVLQVDQLSSAYSAEEITYLVAIGGDGTVSASAAAAMQLDVTLAVVPAGTFNHFAIHMDIPRDIDAAFDLIETGERKRIDLGKVNQHTFINFISVGYYSDIIKSRINLQKQGGLKWTSFASALVKETLLRRHIKLVFTTENGTSVTKVTPLLFIGNGGFTFGGGNVLADRDTIEDNKLHIAILKNYSRPKLLLIGIASMIVDTTKWLAIENYYLSSCTVTAAKYSKLKIALDGEMIETEATLEVESLPSALTVLAPIERS